MIIMANEHILSQLVYENEKEVFKSMRDVRTDLGNAKALLNDEQFNTFIRAATTNQSILQDASFRRMNAMNQIVSSTLIDGRVLQNGYKDAYMTTQDSLTEADVDFGKAELKSTKLKALTSIYDDDKDDNIERDAFEQTLLSMMGEAVGRDLEALCVFGDASYTSGSPAANVLFNNRSSVYWSVPKRFLRLISFTISDTITSGLFNWTNLSPSLVPSSYSLRICFLIIS